MIEPTVIRGLSDAYGSWKTNCIFRRNARSSRVFLPSTSSPRKRTDPDVGSTSLRIERPVVVFPHPDSPTSPRVFPARTRKLTPETALTEPIRRSFVVYRSVVGCLGEVARGPMVAAEVVQLRLGGHADSGQVRITASRVE